MFAQPYRWVTQIQFISGNKTYYGKVHSLDSSRELREGQNFFGDCRILIAFSSKSSTCQSGIFWGVVFCPPIHVISLNCCIASQYTDIFLFLYSSVELLSCLPHFGDPCVVAKLLSKWLPVQTLLLRVILNTGYGQDLVFSNLMDMKWHFIVF